jgi:5-methylcytosine-specific restriction endonuclease McrA
MYDCDMGLALTPSIDQLDTAEVEIERIIGQMNLLHAELVTVISSVIAEGLTVGLGYSSVAHWLSIQSGLSPERCRELITVGTRAKDFPHTLGIMASGAISFDQASVVIRRAPAWADRQAGNMAQYATVSQMRRILGRYPFEDDPAESDPGSPDPGTDTSEQEPPQSAASPPPVTEFVSLTQLDDGSWTLAGHLGAEHGLVLDMALTEARDALFQQVQGGTDSGRFPNLVDALREIADRSLDTVTEPSRRDRFRIYLHLDAQSSTCTDAHGIRVPDALSGLARCEADLRAVLERDGIAVNIGRSSRVIPPHTRRMVIHRDQGCRVPGCLSQQHLHIHHIVEWSRGGPTDTHNLLSLCPHHHRRVHDGHLQIQAPPGGSSQVNADSPRGIRFLDARGKVIGYRALSPPVPITAIPAQRFVHPTGESYDAWSVSFTPPRSDPAVCVRDQN